MVDRPLVCCPLALGRQGATLNLNMPFRTMGVESVRNVLLEVIKEHNSPGASSSSFQSKVVLNEVARRANLRGIAEEQVLLTLWHDLVRTGHIAWGLDILNSDPPFCHLTDQGRKMLEHYSRDPANPDGYLAYLRGRAPLSPIAESYIVEALNTYNSSCYKATAVMVGGASESLILHFRDALVKRMQDLKHKIPSGLNDWRIKRVLDSIESIMAAKKSALPRSLANAFDTYYSAFTGQIRIVRNDAGHPKSVDPVSQDMVQASLLIFPELAKLMHELHSWVNKGYS